MNTINARRLGALTFVAALSIAACGSDDDSTSGTNAVPDASTDTTDTTADSGTSTGSAAPSTDAMDGMDGMDGMDAMNMGDPDATPADDVEGAAVARGEFVLLDTRPAGYDDVSGTAVIARSDRGTTVTTEITGLEPNVDYISHVHAQACDDENAGNHYQFEVGGSTMPPNEIHLAFTSDAEGNGYMTAENDMIAGEDAVSFVVHPAEFIDNKVACADFVEDEPGAIAEVIAAGLSDTDHDAMDDHDSMGDDDAMDDHDAMSDDDADHSEMGDDDADHSETVDLGALDVLALHDLDEELEAGTIDPSTQLGVVDDAISALDEVGETDANAELRLLLVELRGAVESGDLAAASPLATQAHDLAHDMSDHDA